MRLPKLKGQWTINRLCLLSFLSVLILIGTLPGYLRSEWPWSDLPYVENINQVRSIRQTGLDVPGWKTLDQAEVTIGDQQWSIQLIQQDEEKPVTLSLLPQPYYLAHPQVEWVDIKGRENWKTDSQRKLKFTLEQGVASKTTVEARFFRAWNRRQTFAVVQWYAQPNGGHFAPNRWFWADLRAQIHRSRVPWIAVSCKIPIKPLGDLETAQPLAESLVKSVQSALILGPFSKSQ